MDRYKDTIIYKSSKSRYYFVSLGGMKICSVCNLEKDNIDYGKYQHRCNDCIHLYKCYVCQQVYELNKENFPIDTTRATGYGSRCNTCNNGRKKKDNRKYNHNDARRSRMSLKDTLRAIRNGQNGNSIVKYGFYPEQAIIKFRDRSPEFEYDHCIPTSWFKEGTPDNIVHSIHNLQLLHKKDNNKKSNRYCTIPLNMRYLQIVKGYIKEEFGDIFYSL